MLGSLSVVGLWSVEGRFSVVALWGSVVFLCYFFPSSLIFFLFFFSLYISFIIYCLFSSFLLFICHSFSLIYFYLSIVVLFYILPCSFIFSLFLFVLDFFLFSFFFLHFICHSFSSSISTYLSFSKSPFYLPSFLSSTVFEPHSSFYPVPSLGVPGITTLGYRSLKTIEMWMVNSLSCSGAGGEDNLLKITLQSLLT